MYCISSASGKLYQLQSLQRTVLQLAGELEFRCASSSSNYVRVVVAVAMGFSEHCALWLRNLWWHAAPCSNAASARCAAWGVLQAEALMCC
jgi:hypothetical protein